MSLQSTEPVRLYLYSLLAPVVALLAYLGVVDDTSGPLWAALVTALLGIPAVEKARSLVSPVEPPADDEGE